ncbi:MULTISPECIES: multidrug effflux MFS transporter [Achromobacter]|uniref:Bcr/CflA family efflux transporter n=1 Tax=Alcaligenes xylosoxydans xylosoxydans TaxID=85698 RepID=A0A424WBU3_ALCXX|nr:MULTISPECIES: multidrug effflux MFS transporter [Achromobacter]MBC9902711.1 multidrug effflux MFS transporter [Achromobacter xylosoxidans]MBD0868314.1 multidrug effflux MFS transporter [Achromobacter xylosoxidans]QNP83146.1 multidrug effflux MFS transporter [Achromobacter xylosoxidans]RPJ90608.1 Bcr/CflA family efflux MFS transporter [Achromobacter xylosoxidans]WLW58967.1 multidrug effflux MFS transporter [Achromobacter aegrifaciens]
MKSALSPRGQRWLIGLLMGLVTLTPMGIDIYLPSLPVMAQDYGQPVTALQASITLFIFAVGVGQVLIGPLADRYGRRPVALGGALAYLLGSALGAAATSLDVFYVARVIQGLGACSASLVAFAAVRDCFSPAVGARVYSYLNGALCTVPALAPMVGGALAVHAGWRSTFVFMVLFALTLAGFLAIRFEETRAAPPKPHGALYSLRRYAPIAASGRFLYFAAFGMAGMAMILVFVSAAPVVLVQQLGYSELGFSAWFGGNAAINIGAFFLAPAFIARFGRHTMVRVGMAALLAAAAMHLAAWLWLPLSAWVFMLPVAVLTVGFSLALGSGLSLALEPFAERAGTAAAVYGLFQMSGSAVIATLLLDSGMAPQAAMALIGAVIVGPLLCLSPGMARRLAAG